MTWARKGQVVVYQTNPIEFMYKYKLDTIIILIIIIVSIHYTLNHQNMTKSKTKFFKWISNSNYWCRKHI